MLNTIHSWEDFAVMVLCLITDGGLKKASIRVVDAVKQKVEYFSETKQKFKSDRGFKKIKSRLINPIVHYTKEVIITLTDHKSTKFWLQVLKLFSQSSSVVTSTLITTLIPLLLTI